MKYDIAVFGDAWNRTFFYTDKGKYHEIKTPGGAALLAGLLGANGCAVSPVSLTGSYKREMLELRQYKKDKNSDAVYLVHTQAGWTGGKTAMPAKEADCLVYLDAGMGTMKPAAGKPILWAKQDGVPDADALLPLGENILLMLDIAAFRAQGALISRQISWERTATQFMWQLYNNPSFEHLLRVPRMLVAFGEDALIYIENKKGKLAASLVLAHGGAESTLQDSLPGMLPDTWMAMVCAAAMQLKAVVAGKKQLQFAPILGSAESLIATGYDPEILTNADWAHWFGTDAAEDNVNVFDIPDSTGLHEADPDFWCISDHFKSFSLFDLAFRTVKNGRGELKGLPHLSFGALTTVDRREIEAFQNIKNLILEYVNGKANRPLSIAVFGAPGSGKSFGVTQIAKNVLPGVVEKLEFNVSQFTDSGDLSAAFHKVRDVVLSGKLPLVFFDEFDSDRDGQKLGWLKSYLMPMQDGKFKDESGEHPVGKCIFVFAGGTSPSFEDFTTPLTADDPALAEAFKNVKGPDFVSRLRGTINILGPNPAYDGDKNYLLRRAILLRSLCERKLDVKNPNFIDDNLLNAMLVIGKYKHGARSMEAILDMSRLDGNAFKPVSLPFYSQLDLHVDAAAFTRLVLRDVTLNSYSEQLARAIHEYYREYHKQEGGSDSEAMKPWEKLDADLQFSNIRQAKTIVKKLNEIGCSFDAGDAPFPTVEKFTKKEVDALSVLEHQYWVAERRASGWKYGPKKDVKKKISPYLVPWSKLPKKIKQDDINTVLNIIPLLKSIGLRVYRTL